jgi:hypothetical protein
VGDQPGHLDVVRDLDPRDRRPGDGLEVEHGGTSKGRLVWTGPFRAGGVGCCEPGTVGCRGRADLVLREAPLESERLHLGGAGDRRSLRALPAARTCKQVAQDEAIDGTVRPHPKPGITRARAARPGGAGPLRDGRSDGERAKGVGGATPCPVAGTGRVPGGGCGGFWDQWHCWCPLAGFGVQPTNHVRREPSVISTRLWHGNSSIDRQECIDRRRGESLSVGGIAFP